MSKKDYQLVAAALRKTEPTDPNTVDDVVLRAAVRAARLQWLDTLNAFMDLAEKDNPRFDRDRFLTACGVRAFANA